MIEQELEKKLWAYMAGIARNHRMEPWAIGGIEDHIHSLISIPPVISVSDAVRVLKANSSRWMSEHGEAFSWQTGYGSFTVSMANAKRVVAYIENQREHHKKQSFDQEYLALLAKHGIAYDPRFVFD